MSKTIRVVCVFSLLVITALLFSACSRLIESTSDELVQNSYSTTLENSNVITLEFAGDNATFCVNFPNGSKHEISGFCELSDTEFIIYDKSTSAAFCFSYVVHFDSVDIIYNANTVSLHKV